MSRTEIITVEHDCSCGVGCRLSGVDLTCAKCGKVRAVKVDRDPHPSADRIPQFGGALLWREPEADDIAEAERMAEKLVPRLRQAPRMSPPAGVATLGLMLCLLLCGGCQVVAYQHNDYRTEGDGKTNHSVRGMPDWMRRVVPDRPMVHSGQTFPGMFGLSPGIEDLASLAGPDCWVAHSAGAARAVSLIRGGRSPRTLLLIDPWPPNIEVPDGPELVVVVTGRPGRVTVGPGTRAVSKLRASGNCPWAWTVGHIYACRWEESVEAASSLGSGGAGSRQPATSMK